MAPKRRKNQDPTYSPRAAKKPKAKPKATPTLETKSTGKKRKTDDEAGPLVPPPGVQFKKITEFAKNSAPSEMPFQRGDLISLAGIADAALSNPSGWKSWVFDLTQKEMDILIHQCVTHDRFDKYHGEVMSSASVDGSVRWVFGQPPPAGSGRKDVLEFIEWLFPGQLESPEILPATQESPEILPVEPGALESPEILPVEPGTLESREILPADKGTVEPGDGEAVLPESGRGVGANEAKNVEPTARIDYETIDLATLPSAFDEVYCLEREIACAKEHRLFKSYCNQVKLDLGEDADTWTFGDHEGDPCADVEDFIVYVRGFGQPKPSPPEPQKKLDYSNVVFPLRAIFTDPAFSLAYEVHRALQHPLFPKFVKDTTDYPFGRDTPEEDLENFITFLEDNDGADGSGEGGEEEPLEQDPCVGASSLIGGALQVGCDGRVDGDAAKTNLEKKLAAYPDPEDLMGSAAEVMAAILLKAISENPDLPYYENVKTLPSELWIGSGCTGTAAFEEAMLHVASVLGSSFKANFQVVSKFGCENVAWKQKFALSSTCGSECMYEDITNLLQDDNRSCVVHKRNCPLPSRLFGFAAGFSCTSYSRLNKHAKKNATAMERSNEGDPDAEVASVNTFQGCLDILGSSRPDWALLENVKEIETEVGDDTDSNLSLCIAALEDIGYKVECVLMDSRWYGLPQSRRRVYMICLNVKNPKLNTNPVVFFQSLKHVLRLLYIKTPPADKLLLKDKDPAVTQYLDWLMEKKTEQSQENKSWTSMHMSLAEKRGVSWPLQIPQAVSNSQWFEALTPRAKEVVGFAADEKYRMGRKMTFADVYHSANRYSVGGSEVPCVLPRTLAWCFSKQRLLLGTELCRMQGLNFDSDRTAEFTQTQLTNMAGNAFSGNVVVALLMSLIISLQYSTDADERENQDISDMVQGLTYRDVKS